MPVSFFSLTMLFARFPIFTWRHPFFWITGSAALAAIGCIILLLIFLIGQGAPIFLQEGADFLLGREWFPGESYGALPMIYGSLMVTGLALLWALPVALGSAVFTSEFLPPRARWWVKSVMELLAGVPGIVYGLLGAVYLAVWVRDVLGLIDGNTLLTASLLLALMILPTVMTLAEDALRAVPEEYRETALALGLTRVEVALRVVVPRALGGWVGAVLLGLGRAMGETVAVMLVIGGRDVVPSPWFDVFSPGQSIPSKLGREAAEALGSGLHWNALSGLGAVLFLWVMAVSLAARALLRRHEA